MNQKIIIIIGIVAIVGVIGFSIISYESSQETKIDTSIIEEEWNRVGVFGTNKDTYKLGERVFFSGPVFPNQQITIKVITPEGLVNREFYYDGSETQLAKFYFKPDTFRHNGLYFVEQLVGTWTIKFEGVSNEDLTFEMLNEYNGRGAVVDIVDVPNPPPNVVRPELPEPIKPFEDTS